MNKRKGTRFFKFCLVGGLNTTIDFAVFYFLTYCGLPYVPAQAVSYSCGVLNSFFMNRTWTFRQKERAKRREFLTFIAVNLFTLTLTTWLLSWIDRLFGWPLLLSKLLVIGCGLSFNFIGTKCWVFSIDKQQETKAGLEKIDRKGFLNGKEYKKS